MFGKSLISTPFCFIPNLSYHGTLTHCLKVFWAFNFKHKMNLEILKAHSTQSELATYFRSLVHRGKVFYIAFADAQGPLNISSARPLKTGFEDWF